MVRGQLHQDRPGLPVAGCAGNLSRLAHSTMTLRLHRPVFATFLSLASALACRHTEGAKPIAAAHSPLVLGTAAATSSLVIDVGASDVILTMDEPQPVLISNGIRHDLRDSVSYALETKPAECAEANVSPGRIAEKHRAKHCYARWSIRIPRIPDVRVRVSAGDVVVVAPADRAVRTHAQVGTVRLTLDDRELQHGKSPGSGDEFRIGDISALPRLDVRTGVGSIRAELKTRR
jgi:hypothetical protein